MAAHVLSKGFENWLKYNLYSLKGEVINVRSIEAQFINIYIDYLADKI